ncbi:uncharacterized protein A4U43_C04F15030 [Asparagus officinalis]|uniref:AAA+ ATPase At3g28540-like C-terminal domain-containing protein n=1 Tax=Asparagus officinalis TaxID=4686 RepID=A0A5P1F3P6_ASPOF|nr:uncharacterized protein A4U43_C04F15030 [Asparagus officinalis]
MVDAASWEENDGSKSKKDAADSYSDNTKMFTTNHKEKLDPALLQPGRNMGYCIFSGFRVLASNYHSINGHPLFGGIEGLSGEVKVTLAEVIGDDEGDDSEVALNGLIGFLKRKKIQGGR